MLPTVRTTHRGDTRQRILDSALHLFAERGYAGTSIRDIAEELEITKAAVHYHFPSKEGMIEALLEPFIATFRSLVEQSSPGPADGRRMLLQVRDVLEAASPLLSVLTGDPSIAAACGDLHRQGRQAGEGLALALVGPGASATQLLRAHAALSAFLGGWKHCADGGAAVTDAETEVLIEAALACLG